MPSSSRPARDESTVLIVEDDPRTSLALSRLLRECGWKVNVVETVADALAFLDSQIPKSIILDLMLPDGDGSQILERVRKSGMNVRVTVTTASIDSARLQRVRALQPNALLSKPLEFSDLLRVM